MKNKIILSTILILVTIVAIIAIYFVINKKEENFNSFVDTTNTITNTTKTNNTNSNVRVVTYNYNDYKNLPINYVDVEYMYDTSTPEKAIGVVDYAFIYYKNRIQISYGNGN